MHKPILCNLVAFIRANRIYAILIVLPLILTACKTPQTEPDYSRQLQPGENPLIKLSPDQWPNIRLALINRVNLEEASTRSYDWFAKPSTKQFFPSQSISHSHAQLSVLAFNQILAENPDPTSAAAAIEREFDCYSSLGYDRDGSVLFTGYYTPIFDASYTKTALYQYPLYKRPPDLVTDPDTGHVLGRSLGNAVVTYPTRKNIEQNNTLAGLEIAYLREPFDPYIIQVQGSAKLQMTDGTTLYLGYAGHNGHPYTSVAQLMVKDGIIKPEDVSLQTLRQYFRDNPENMMQYIQRNDRFVFFKEYPSTNWPAGSLGFKVTPLRSLATDKSIFPRAGVVLVKTRIPSPDGGTRAFSQFMFDQDTGGAIKAPGRADIYMGSGDRAEQLAGRQFATGNLYYFFLKYDRIHYWRTRVEQPVSTN